MTSMPLVSFLRSFAWPLLPSPNLAATPNRALPPPNRAPAPSMSNTGARTPRRAGETRQDRQWREAGRYCEDGADLGARATGDLWPALQVILVVVLAVRHRRSRLPSLPRERRRPVPSPSHKRWRPPPSPPRGLLLPLLAAYSSRQDPDARERRDGNGTREAPPIFFVAARGVGGASCGWGSFGFFSWGAHWSRTYIVGKILKPQALILWDGRINFFF